MTLRMSLSSSITRIFGRFSLVKGERVRRGLAWLTTLGFLVSTVAGKRMVKADPMPASLVTMMSPFIICANCFEIARPRPVPP